MYSLRRSIFVVIGLFITCVSSAYAEKRVVCESTKDRRTYCDIERAYDADIRISRQLSNASCDEGYSWGRDDRGIWVDNGCRAEFAVSRRYGGHDDYEDRDRGYDRERRDLERERDRLEAERQQLEREKAAASQPKIAPLNCPPGTHPSTHRCTKEERKRGCKDYGANDGTGRGCSNF